MNKLPKDILIKIISNIQDPKQLTDFEINENILKLLQEKVDREKINRENKNIYCAKTTTTTTTPIKTIILLCILFYYFI